MAQPQDLAPVQSGGWVSGEGAAPVWSSLLARRQSCTAAQETGWDLGVTADPLKKVHAVSATCQVLIFHYSLIT